MIDLYAIKARLQAATPGKWDLYLKHFDEAFPTTVAFSQIAAYDNETKTHMVMVRLGAPDKMCMEKKDADLICNATTDIAQLIEALEIAMMALDCIEGNDPDDDIETAKEALEKIRGAK